MYEQQSLRPPELGGGEMGSGWGTTDPPLHTHLCRICAWLYDQRDREGGKSVQN